ncbi:MAG TPA: YqaJ viral recombinase family protein [Acidimicrobiales bacterium]|jgi:putative phage-type endonuclease|nr:YqaJ viral recombinase family protein [Acidimicrobiales bacterium]
MATPLPEFDAEILADVDTLAREEWLELRRTGLGGSDAAATLSLSPYTSQVALYLDKVDPLPDEDKEIFQAGRRAEPMIAQWFADDTTFEVARSAVMLRSHRRPFMLGNVDRFVYDEAADEWAVLEIKNVDRSKAHEWADGPPIHARLQGLHYLEVCGENFKRLYVAALVGGNRFIHYVVERDEELMARLVAAEEKFWTLVHLQRMPDIDDSESTRKALLAHAGTEAKEIEVPARFVELLESRATMKAMLKVQEAQLRAVENEMSALMKDGDVATCHGVVVAKWLRITVPTHEVKEFTKRQWNIPKKEKQQ